MTDPNPTEQHTPEDAAVEKIVGKGPSGAFAVAGVATAIVVLLFLAFYVLIYLPRGSVQ